VRIAPSASTAGYAATLNPGVVHRRSMLPMHTAGGTSLRQHPQMHTDFVSNTLGGRLRSNSNAGVVTHAAEQSFHLSPLGENTILGRLQRTGTGEETVAVPIQVWD
jgi:hypothetical protein